MNEKSAQVLTNKLLDDLERGEITAEQALAGLIEAGNHPEDAAEMVFIALGGSDIIEPKA